MKRKICILLIGDQIDMLKFSHYYLSTIDYNVVNAKTSLQGIQLASEILPHLIIIDEMMADMSGIETCKEIRKIPDLFETKIIFLSDHSEDQNQITGYDAGLDDFVTKPIKPKVLTSKIRALVRNFKENESPLVAITLGNLVINKEEYTITNGKTKYDLPKKEFELLSLLASSPGRVFQRREIIKKIWGEANVGSGSIEVKIKYLRDKVGKDKIVTIKGEGYKIIP